MGLGVRTHRHLPIGNCMCTYVRSQGTGTPAPPLWGVGNRPLSPFLSCSGLEPSGQLLWSSPWAVPRGFGPYSGLGRQPEVRPREAVLPWGLQPLYLLFSMCTNSSKADCWWEEGKWPSAAALTSHPAAHPGPLGLWLLLSCSCVAQTASDLQRPVGPTSRLWVPWWGADALVANSCRPFCVLMRPP